MKKIVFYSEVAYICGVPALALGVVLLAKAGFGLSMVAAPAYLLYVKLSQFWSFFTFGMSSYAVQGLLLLVMVVILRRARVFYLFSFVTGVLQGYILDLFMWLLSHLGDISIGTRIVLFAVGFLSIAFGIALMFRTYIPSVVYDLFVKEVSAHFGKNITRFKTAFDCMFCVAAVTMSFSFFGFMHFEGINVGTIFSALFNGWAIGKIGRWMDKHFEFKDKLNFRHYFEDLSKSRLSEVPDIG